MNNLLNLYLIGGMIGCGISFIKNMVMIGVGILHKDELNEILQLVGTNVKETNIGYFLEGMKFIVCGIALFIMFVI